MYVRRELYPEALILIYFSFLILITSTKQESPFPSYMFIERGWSPFS